MRNAVVLGHYEGSSGYPRDVMRVQRSQEVTTNPKKARLAAVKRLASDPDFGFVSVVAMRYSLGRQTYAPGLVTDFIKRYWSLLNESTKGVLLRDLTDEIDSGRSLGSDFDAVLWVEFKHWLKEHQKD